MNRIKKKYIVIAIILIAVFWYLMANRWKIQRYVIGRRILDNSIDITQIEPSDLDLNKNLYKGVMAPLEVAQLQREMVDIFGVDLGQTGPSVDGVDGVFGPQTQAALMELTGENKTTLSNWKKFVTQTVQIEKEV